MKAFTAAWICPVDRAPIQNGVIEVDQGLIAAIGTRGAASSQVHDLGNVAAEYPAIIFVRLLPTRICKRVTLPTGKRCLVLRQIKSAAAPLARRTCEPPAPSTPWCYVVDETNFLLD